MSETTTNTATKKRVLVDAYVRIDLYVPDFYWSRGPEHYAKALENAVREFEEFLRDHRHQDANSLQVVREYEDVCSVCGKVWEPVTDEEGMFCASCGTPIAGGDK